MARAKLPKQPVVKPVQSHHLHLVELVECPLCIEPLDATDRDFWPCPCGYQVCLFCYQRLQSEYNNCCPNCRQQYSDDLDGVRQHIARKQQQQKVEAAQQVRGGASGSSHTAGHHHPHHHAAPHAHTAHGPAGRTKLAGNAAKQRAAHGEAHTAHGRGTAHQANEAHNSSLPPTASWAVASAAAAAAAGPAGTSTPEPPQQQLQQQQQEPPPPAAGDESAWPSLGAAQQQQQQQRPDTANGHERRRSSSSSLAAVPQQQQPQQQQAVHRFDASRSSFESTGSTHTVHSERQQRLQHHLPQDEGRHSDSDAQSQAQEQEETEQQQLEQQLERHSSGFTTVEVSTVVSGKRHDVCVHVSHAEEVRVYPEAAVLLDMLQQAVHSSKLSSTEAAVQLVQCLRKLECDSGSNGSKHGTWLQQVLAAKGNGTTPHSAGRPPLASRAPPPGFGPTAARAGGSATANGISGSHHHVQQQQHAQQQVQQHELPPAGWSSAQRSFQQQQVHGETPQGSMHSVDSTNSLFSQGSSLSQSMWTDNGLPGVDLGVGVTRLAGGLGTGLPAAVPARLQMLWANGTNGLNSSVSNGLGYSSSTPTGPPPGFGGAAGDLGLGSRLNGTYNPLSFANAGAAQQSSSIGLPPGFGLSSLGAADVGAAAASKQQQQQQQMAQPALYQPF